MHDQPIVVKQIFAASPNAVWKAITDKDEMKHWYFSLEEFSPEHGFLFRFVSGPDPDRQYLHLCEVTEVDPGKKLAYSWRYEGFEGISLVTFELLNQDGGTLLQLTHAGLGSFPASNPDFDRSNFEQGWTAILSRSLFSYLEKER
jgi:uncharacterized protein YndB with AHSA1/START domain